MGFSKHNPHMKCETFRAPCHYEIESYLVPAHFRRCAFCRNYILHVIDRILVPQSLCCLFDFAPPVGGYHFSESSPSFVSILIDLYSTPGYRFFLGVVLLVVSHCSPGVSSINAGNPNKKGSSRNEVRDVILHAALNEIFPCHGNCVRI